MDESVHDVAPAMRFDVFLSYDSRDRVVVQAIAERLKRAGIEPWLDRWSLVGGESWQAGLEDGLRASRACAVFVGGDPPERPGDGANGAGWRAEEVQVAVNRAARQSGFRVVPVLLPGVSEPFDPIHLPAFLATRMWVDFRGGVGDPRALQDLVNAIRGVPFGPDAPDAPVGGIAPYRGLRAFHEEDAALFFGRGREVQRLLETLKGSRFVAVVGRSGSGKSSLVRAGLIPQLCSERGEPWGVCTLRPGAAPLTALAAQLGKLDHDAPLGATLDRLADDPRTLHLVVAAALADAAPDARVAIVVDQLEELFTICRDEPQRRQFLALLHEAVLATGGRTVVVTTMRADFYARCAAYAGFAQLLGTHQLLLGPLDEDGLRQAIEQPARLAGLELEEGLAETVVADVGNEPGALPLLEHALLELWERRRGTMLTLEGYRATGGVDGALAQRADAVYDALTVQQQGIARRLLLRLTQPGEGTEDARRREARGELAASAPGVEFNDVLMRLVDARLLTTDLDEHGDEVVDVAHEALIRHWPRLRGWIDSDRAGLLLHRRLTVAAREWDALDRDPAALYRGARLAAAREWAAAHGADLSASEGDFLAASQAAAGAELQAARRRARRFRALAGGLAALTLVVTLVSGWALKQRADAQDQRAAAERESSRSSSLGLATTASSLVSTRPDVAAILALAAYRESPQVQARSSAMAGLLALRSPGLLAVLHGHTDVVGSVAFSRDGRMLASASADRTIRIWDARTGKQIGSPLAGHRDDVTQLAFDPDGRMLVSSGEDNTVRFWSLRSHRQVGPPIETGTLSAAPIFSSDGSVLALTSVAPPTLWNPRTRKQIRRLRGGIGYTATAFSRDGRTITAATGDTVVSWSVRTGKRTRRQPGDRLPPNDYPRLALSADARLLAITKGFADHEMIRLRDVRRNRPLGPLLSSPGGIVQMAFSRDGRVLAAAGHKTRLWDTKTHRLLGPVLSGRDASFSVAISADGDRLATGSFDGTIRIRDLRAYARLRVSHAPQRGDVTTAVFSPDTRSLFTSRGGVSRMQPVPADPMRRTPSRRYGAALDDAGRAQGEDAFASPPLISRDGSTLVRQFGGLIGFYDTRTLKQRGSVFRAATDSLLFPSDLAINDDGTLIAYRQFTGAEPGIRIIEAHTRARLPAPPTSALSGGQTSASAGLAFSPDGRTLAFGTDTAVRLWDLQERKLRRGAFARQGSEVQRLVFSQDGGLLVVTGADQSTRFLDPGTGKAVGAPLRGVGEDASVSPDGSVLAAPTGRGTVQLWDVRHAQALGTPLKVGSGAFSVAAAFRPDGRSVVVAASDGTIHEFSGLFWRTASELQREVCDVVGDGLRPDEWRQFAQGFPFRRTCL